MSDVFSKVSRRSLLKGATAVAGAAALGSFPLRAAKAETFPSKSMRVAIPTGEGGGVEEAARAFTAVWTKKLGQGFEYSYYPGASGQVGYEIFVKKLDADAHTLLFGNIGPEMIMYATQNPGYKFRTTTSISAASTLTMPSSGSARTASSRPLSRWSRKARSGRSTSRPAVCRIRRAWACWPWPRQPGPNSSWFPMAAAMPRVRPPSPARSMPAPPS